MFFRTGDTVVIYLSSSLLEVRDNFDEQTQFTGEMQLLVIGSPQSESKYSLFIMKNTSPLTAIMFASRNRSCQRRLLPEWASDLRKFSLNAIPLVFALCLTSTMWGQQSAVSTEISGNRVYLEMNLSGLQADLDTLFARTSSSSSSSLTWSDVLSNGGTPGMDVNFNGYDALGLENVFANGRVTADSLVVNLDAEIAGRLNLTGVAQFGDSLQVAGYVQFSDSLTVTRAVAIGTTLAVTGVTSLGDSLHVVGNVDFDAVLNVDGAGMFGSTLEVAGVTTLNDSLHVNGNVEITKTLVLDSLFVADVIDGQVNSLGNFTSDALMEGDSNLYFTSAERTLLASLSEVLNTLDSLTGVIEALGGDAPAGSFSCGDSLNYNGYDYTTVQIGDQCWFAENLQTEAYNNGDAIPGGLSTEDWIATTLGAQLVYAGDEANLNTYGRIYNWYAVGDERGLCPSGWHVPTDEEWTTLTDFLGGGSVAGLAMKSSSSDSPAWNGNNESGFSALPGGWRLGSNGDFSNEGSNGYWWSASPNGSSGAWSRSLYAGYGNVYRFEYGTRFGFSVRCLRD